LEPKIQLAPIAHGEILWIRHCVLLAAVNAEPELVHVVKLPENWYRKAAMRRAESPPATLCKNGCDIPAPVPCANTYAARERGGQSNKPLTLLRVFDRLTRLFG